MVDGGQLEPKAQSSADGAETTAPASADDHYVMLDAMGERHGKNPRSIDGFPRDADAARVMFESRQIPRGGRLPWTIERRYDELVAAWKSGDDARAALAAGALLHLATDVAMPFNTTADPDGQESRNVHWSTSEDDVFSRTHRTPRLRMQVELIERMRSRLVHEVRVAPERVGSLTDRRWAVFHELETANRCLDDWLTRERKITESLMIDDGRGLEAAVDRYYGRLTDEIAPMMETRLEAGVLLGAGLIVSAWEAAGRGIPTVTAESRADRSDRAASEGHIPPVEGADFIGSREGSVFHRPTCRHVLRIRPENVVRFSTVEGAEAAGRKPCKACEPE